MFYNSLLTYYKGNNEKKMCTCKQISKTKNILKVFLVNVGDLCFLSVLHSVIIPATSDCFVPGRRTQILVHQT